MSEMKQRFERIMGQFTDRVQGVAPGDWDNPSPCEGWTARDVVGHLAEWVPGFFGTNGVEFPPIPSVQDDPVGAWETLIATVTVALDDPELAERQVETPMQTQSFAETVDMIFVGDVFVHTWDLARATGQDETLDPEQVAMMMAGLADFPEEVLRGSGMYGPAVEAPPDADDQTKLLAFLGRRA